MRIFWEIQPSERCKQNLHIKWPQGGQGPYMCIENIYEYMNLSMWFVQDRQTLVWRSNVEKCLDDGKRISPQENPRGVNYLDFQTNTLFPTQKKLPGVYITAESWKESQILAS